jgi:gliding motility-associated-like protein
VGAFQNTNYGDYDCFVAKFDSSGQQLWTTYFGGSAEDECGGISIDKFNNIIFVGHTLSINFPTSFGAFQTNHYVGNFDGFITKLLPNGLMVWSTLYGGTDDDLLVGVCTDNAKNIYVNGLSASPDFPTTVGAYQTVNTNSPNTNDAVIFKLDPNGQPIWSTYFGGSGNDYGYEIAIYNSAFLVITGETQSPDLPMITPSFQNTYMGNGDAFILKISVNGQPLWSTYYGGSTGEEVGLSTCTDDFGNIYVSGRNTDANFPISINAYQSTYGGGKFDCFVLKFDSVGKRLWATFLGGALDDYNGSIIASEDKHIYVSGSTSLSTTISTNNFPTTTCSFQDKFGGDGDGFISKFDTTGNLICSTYIGKQNREACGKICTWGKYIYVPGTTMGPFPVTNNAFQTVFGGGYLDAFLAKLCAYNCGQDISGSGFDFNSNQTAACNNQPIDFNFKLEAVFCDSLNTNYEWYFPGGQPGTSNIKNPSGIKYSSPGTYMVKLIVQSPCGSDSLIKSTYITINNCNPTVSVQSNTICVGECTNITASGSGGNSPYTYAWSNGFTGTGPFNLCPLGTTGYTVTVTDKMGNTSTGTSIITVNSKPVLNFSANDSICQGQSITLTANGAFTYSWKPSIGLNSTTSNSVVASPPSTITYTIIGSIGNCIDSANVIVTVNPNPVVTVSSDQTLMYGKSIVIAATGGTTYSWSPLTGLNDPAIANPTASPTNTTVYTVTVKDSNGCHTTASVTIDVYRRNCNEDDIFIATAFSPNNDGQNDIIKIHSNWITTIDWAIFNRWGEKVFQTNDINKGWDGSQNGRPANSGTYTYYMTATCSQTVELIQRKGYIILTR